MSTWHSSTGRQESTSAPSHAWGKHWSCPPASRADTSNSASRSSSWAAPTTRSASSKPPLNRHGAIHRSGRISDMRTPRPAGRATREEFWGEHDAMPADERRSPGVRCRRPRHPLDVRPEPPEDHQVDHVASFSATRRASRCLRAAPTFSPNVSAKPSRASSRTDILSR